jgi:hypothetical protein
VLFLRFDLSFKPTDKVSLSVKIWKEQRLPGGHRIAGPVMTRKHAPAARLMIR